MATITGSSTTQRGFHTARPSATAAITSAVPSMPILTATTARSPSTESICWRTNAASTAWIPCTPSVFWAVSAVITELP